MLRALFLAAAALAATESAPDQFISIESVELPLTNLDPRKMTVVVNQKLRGCREVIKPVVWREGNVIRVYPQSQPQASRGRGPCATKTQITKQNVQLGRLSRGQYRLQVFTEDSRIFKVLNIY